MAVKEFPRTKNYLGNVIAIGNQKGGVGKSTNVTHLAAALGEIGYKVLVIDLDPTAGATNIFGVPTDAFLGTLELLKGEETLNDCLVEDGVEFTRETEEGGEVITGTVSLPQGVSLIPGREGLGQLEDWLYTQKYVNRLALLDKPLKSARKQFDFIFLDTPPQPGSATTLAAYTTADWFLLSSTPEGLAMQALASALAEIATVQKHQNKNLEVIGLLLSRAKKSVKYFRMIQDVVDKVFPGRAFETAIGESVVFQTAFEKGITLFQDPKLSKHACADSYREVAKQIVWRTKNRDKFLNQSNKLLKQANG